MNQQGHVDVQWFQWHLESLSNMWVPKIPKHNQTCLLRVSHHFSSFLIIDSLGITVSFITSAHLASGIINPRRGADESLVPSSRRASAWNEAGETQGEIAAISMGISMGFY